MSKKFDLETSGFTFTNKILALYKTKRVYRKQNAFFAEQLLSYSIDAGVCVQSFLQSGVRDEKITYAKQAVAIVDRTLYVVSIMEEQKMYKAHQTKDLVKYGAQLKKALVAQINRLSTPVIIDKPAAPAEVIVPDPIIVKKYADPVILHDEDGFDDVFEDEE